MIETSNPIRLARRAAGLSQVDLAAKARLSLPTVALAERCGSVSPRTIARITRALNITPEKLAGQESAA